MKLVHTEPSARHDVVTTEWSTTADSGHLYWAFTEGLGDWLGEPRSMPIDVAPGAAFCIEVGREWGGGAHYGRFVELRRDRRVAMKWIGESSGGVESDVVIDIRPTAEGSDVTIAHAAIADREARMRAQNLWDGARHALEAIISSSQPRD